MCRKFQHIFSLPLPLLLLLLLFKIRVQRNATEWVMRASARVCSHTFCGTIKGGYRWANAHADPCASVAHKMHRAFAADAKRDRWCARRVRIGNAANAKRTVVTWSWCFAYKLRPISHVFILREISEHVAADSEHEHATCTSPPPPRLKCLHLLFPNYVLDHSSHRQTPKILIYSRPISDAGIFLSVVAVVGTAQTQSLCEMVTK